ncbi:MAG: urea ABC transporter permease subunit UrtB, partial [Pseudomonadota bacterium]
MNRLAGLICTLLLVLSPVYPSHASPEKFSVVLERDFKLIQRSSVKTVSPVLEALQESGFEGTSEFLTRWQDKELWYRTEDNRFFYVVEENNDTYSLTDVVTGGVAGTAGKREIRQIKPNSGVRRLLGASLAQFRLLSPDPQMRLASLDSIARDPKPEHLPAVRKALVTETDPDLKNRFERFERLLTMQFAETVQERVSAINSFSDSLSLEVRAALNPLLATRTGVATVLPENANIARVIEPGETYTDDFQASIKVSTLWWGSGRTAEHSLQDAYAILVAEGLAPAVIAKDERDQILAANIVNGQVGGYEVGSLDSDESRDLAYAQLVADGQAKASPGNEEIRTLVGQHVYFARFVEPDPAVTDAVRATLETINASVRWNTFLDLALDAISLASIYFLAAIGLAITFGVMRVINMAHGEFIMMGAYSGYVVQQFITNYTLSIVVAIP